MDVASSNTLNLITNKKDRGFLLAQRNNGSSGYGTGISRRKIEHRRMLKKRRRQLPKEEAFTFYATVDVESSTSSRVREESSKNNIDAFGRVRSSRKKKAERESTNITTSSLTGAPERSKCSDRKAVFCDHRNFRSLESMLKN